MHADDTHPSSPVLQVLVDNHRQFLAFLERRVGSRAIAEDLLQEAFVRGVDQLGTLRDDESAVAWFYRSLRNAVIDYYRRHARSQKALDSFKQELDEHEDPAPDTRNAVCQCVARLATNLKPEYAEILRRTEVEGATVKDYAEEAGITPNNAAVRAFRAREALRKQVAVSCGTCADHGCLDCTCKMDAPHA